MEAPFSEDKAFFEEEQIGPHGRNEQGFTVAIFEHD